MGRRIQVTVIDDKKADSAQAIEILKRYAEVDTVDGVDELLGLLARLDRKPGATVDVILTDLNMEFDETPLDFLFRNDSHEVRVNPQFEIRGLAQNRHEIAEAMEADGPVEFKPYGPILALPLVRYFRDGGVIAPISAFWNSARLFDQTNGRINGYVLVALNLIWRQSRQVVDAGGFGAYFSDLYKASTEVSPAFLYLSQFQSAIRQRRQQLLRDAVSVQGLEDLDLDQLREDHDVVIWTAGHNRQVIDRKSLFADFLSHLDSLEAQDEAQRQRMALLLRERLETELERAVSALDVQDICDFCEAYASVLGDMGDKPTFQQIYAMIQARLDGGVDRMPTLNAASELPSRYRRYMFLTAQLHLLATRLTVADDWDDAPVKKRQSPGNPSARRTATDEAAAEVANAESVNPYVCRALGVNLHANTLSRLVPGANGQPQDAFCVPFWSEPQQGWQGFNILRRVSPTKPGHWVWTDLDRAVATAVWSSLDMGHLPLPHGLGDPSLT